MNASPGPVDWIHPPAGVTEATLPASLRYAAVIGFQCDRLKRTVLIELLPCTDEGTPEPPLLFSLGEVASTRATSHELWPGGLTIPPDASREDRVRLVSEFKAKCTEVSVDWAACETAIAGGGFAILDAAWISAGEALSLRLDVVDGKTRGYSLTLRAGRIDVTTADGTPLRLERL